MKASRLALLAAAQLFCAGLMGEPALASNALSVWSNLWHTPDQQGQALLDAGQPAQAAERFHDPRRRAYADLQAGRYQDAAKLLAPFDDAESEYNRGNALAKSGQLRAALAAYDAALKQAPADKDIRHNRDLVERALRQQRQSPQSSSHNGKQGNQGAASSGQQSQQSSAGQQGGSGSQQAGGASQRAGGSQQGGTSQQPGASQQSGDSGSQSAGESQTASNGSQSGANQPGNSGAPQATDAYGSGSSKEEPGQAQRDAALAAKLAREQRQHGGPGRPTQGQGPERNGASDLAPNGARKTPDTGSLLAGGTQAPKQKPETERQLALDQWLRQIPDSPAGLLQRKFLIEHMMRQQGSDDPQGSEDSQGTGP
jgi:Ca-activated chloride channel family protein